MRLIVIIGLTSFVAASAFADSASIELDAGVLRGRQTAVGVTPAPEPLQGLLQIIASPSGSATNFSAPVPGSFTAGDNIIAVTLAMNYNGGNVGETDNLFTLTTASSSNPATATAFDVGDPLLLRWWPGFTVNTTNPNNPVITRIGGGANTPQAGDFYGQFRSSTADPQFGGIPYTAPASSPGTYSLFFLTTDVGGSQASSSGYANFTVMVPEPSTYALIGLGLGGLALGIRRRQQGKAMA